jgi:hypothetical protein
MNKKLSVYLILSLMTLILMTNFVSAITVAERVTKLIDGTKEVAAPLFNTLFGNSQSGGQLAIQILAFLLVVFVIYGILGSVDIFGGNQWINMGIGVIVAIIGTRFLPAGFLESAAIPSSALVATIVMGIPFILAFFLIEKVSNSYIRRVLWVAYGVMIFVLWVYNFDNPQIGEAIWIYPLILLAVFVAFLFDGTFQRFMGKAKSQRSVESAADVARYRIVSDIEKLQNALATATIAKDRNDIAKKIAQKKEALKKL